MARRILLGTKSGLATRIRVYLAADAVEVDEIEGYTGTRKRVLLDEVLLVTLDRRRRGGALVLLGIMALFFPITFAFSFRALDNTWIVASAIMSSPFLVAFIVYAWLGIDHVTVFGKRTTAVMAFALRKGKARRTFALLRDRIARAQDAERARIAAEGNPSAPAPPPAEVAKQSA
jgi:hypothetical protein